MIIVVKRVYDPISRADGMRVLVDRLWPRGLAKSQAGVDEWLRGLAPSTELRQWFHAHTDQWTNFRKRYLKELGAAEAESDLNRLYSLARAKKRLTLVFASKNEQYNNAVVLKELLAGKPTLPTRAGSGGANVARKRRGDKATR